MKIEPVPYAKLDDPQSLNLYAYVGNNPTGRIDPDGHFTGDHGFYDYFATEYQAQMNQAYQMDVSVATAAREQHYEALEPKDHFISYSDWPDGAGHFHHGGLAVDNNDTQGYSTKNPKLFVLWRLLGFPKGRMEDDIGMHPGQRPSYTHIMVTASQAAATQKAIDERRAHPGRYNLLFNNCAQAAESFLNSGEGVYGIPLGLVNIPFVLHWFVEKAAQ